MTLSHHAPAVDPQARITRADGSPIRAVVVDDEDSLTDLLSMALRYEGWDVKLASDGQKALSVIREFRPDVVVLDVMLPDIDGLTVLARLRADGIHVPILFLTAKDAVEDRVAGLTVGGDDYVTKPFSLEELVARLRALIRRSALAVSSSGDSVITVGDLTLDEDSYEVRRGGVAVELTATEFALLLAFMRRPGRVLGRETLLRQVWGHDYLGDSRMVDVHINRLRAKVEADPANPQLIATVRGFGYRMIEA